MREQVALIAIALGLAGGGCGWKVTRRYPSPDGSAALLLSQPRFVERSGTRLVLRERTYEVLLHEERGDDFFSLALPYWSADKRVVGFYSCAEPYLRVAFDRIKRQAIPFSRIEPPIKRMAIAKYPFTATASDPLLELCASAGTKGFWQKYGDATQP